MKKIDEETERLVSDYIEAEKKLIAHLEEKEGGDELCKCGSDRIIETVYTDDDGIVSRGISIRCLNCGGYKEG